MYKVTQYKQSLTDFMCVFLIYLLLLLPLLTYKIFVFVELLEQHRWKRRLKQVNNDYSSCKTLTNASSGVDFHHGEGYNQ